jgi:rod shape-determining protein MreC
MTYRRSKSRVVLAALLAASVTVVTLGYRSGTGGPLHKIQQGALTLVSPLQSGVTSVLSPVGNFFDSIGHIPTLSSQNAQLRKELAADQAALNQFPALRQQLNQLSSLQGETPWISGPTLGAEVISEGPSNQEWTVFLDKGSDDHVAVGMAVVAQAGLVGRITLVNAHSSKVLLLLDPTSSAGGRLVSSGPSNGITGLVQGSGAGDLSFGLLGVTSTVNAGDQVVTSGYDGGIYPPAIPIGRVATSYSADNGLSRVASIQPYVNFNTLSYVDVLLGTKPVPLAGQ